MKTSYTTSRGLLLLELNVTVSKGRGCSIELLFMPFSSSLQCNFLIMSQCSQKICINIWKKIWLYFLKISVNTNVKTSVSSPSFSSCHFRFPCSSSYLCPNCIWIFLIHSIRKTGVGLGSLYSTGLPLTHSTHRSRVLSVEKLSLQGKPQETSGNP